MAGYIGNKAVNLSTSGADISGTANLDIVDIDGAVDMASTLAVAGVVTANAGVVVDNFTLDGTTLALSSGDFTVDVAGDIILDADGGDVNFQDGGVLYGFMSKSNNNLLLGNAIQDGDVLIRGNDGGSNITALTLDMSAAGAATFNAPITTIGSAAASTNVELKLNGVASKAQRIAFNEGGTNRWLLGQGAASESSTFELYNAGGVIALSVDRTSNIATFQRGAVFNEGSADSDFRVESDADANCFVVNGGTNAVYVGSFTAPVVGTEKFGVKGGTASNSVGIAASVTHNTGTPLFLANGSNTTSNNLIRFSTGSGGDTRATITYNGSVVVYATSSDYRLKENINYNFNATEKLKQLKPAEYRWIESQIEDIGFIAHEVAEIVPNAVTGKKDAVDENGKIDPQGYDAAKLVPILIKTVQELEARITALES